MALELFTKKGSKLGVPRVTITKAGQLILNYTCLDKYFRGKKYVRLYGDRENKMIGIEPIDKETDNSFCISYSSKRTNGSISGHSFLNHLGIDFKSGSGRFTPEWKDNMLIIKVDQGEIMDR